VSRSRGSRPGSRRARCSAVRSCRSSASAACPSCPGRAPRTCPSGRSSAAGTPRRRPWIILRYFWSMSIRTTACPFSRCTPPMSPTRTPATRTVCPLTGDHGLGRGELGPHREWRALDQRKAEALVGEDVARHAEREHAQHADRHEVAEVLSDRGLHLPVFRSMRLGPSTSGRGSLRSRPAA